jgi:D-threo-aldose 1-dehydrogenase
MSRPQPAPRRRLGRTDVAVTSLGLGAAPLGNLYAPIDDEAAERTIGAAWDCGIRWFDTAPHYGLGLSERRLGRALRTRPRADYVVSTKVGRLLDPIEAPSGDDLAAGFAVPATHRRRWDFSADGVHRSLEDSLARLGLDRVDLVFVHDPDDHVDWALREAVPALVALRDQGVVGAVGVGMNRAAPLAHFVAEADVDAVLLAGRYTLLDQTALDELLPHCTARGVAVLIGGVFNSGLLSRPWPADDTTYDYRPVPRELLVRARRLAEVCDRHGVTLPQAAVQFPRGHEAVRAALIGARSPQEIKADAALAAAPLPPTLWADLRAEGLLDPRAPQPSDPWPGDPSC